MSSSYQQGNLFELATPAMPELDKSRIKIKPIGTQTAAAMVKEFHYAHRVPSITVAVGMYVDGVLAGCITYGVSANRNIDLICGEEHKGHVLELNRLFVHDWCGKNSESYLVGQSFRYMEQSTPEFYILVSYADSAHGHLGKIYQATNWLYTGESLMGTEGWVIDGKVYHPRTLSGVLGSCAAEVILSKFPQAKPVKGEVKYRYVKFLGPRDRERKLKEALKFPVKPYPKEIAENKHERDESGATVTILDGEELLDPKEEAALKRLLEGPKTRSSSEDNVKYAKAPHACCPLAMPLDCPGCAIAIECPKHGEQHSAGCPIEKMKGGV